MTNPRPELAMDTRLPDKTLIRKIAQRLNGIEYDDLTKAERQIADLLIGQNYMEKRPNGEVVPK